MVAPHNLKKEADGDLRVSGEEKTGIKDHHPLPAFKHRVAIGVKHCLILTSRAALFLALLATYSSCLPRCAAGLF